MTEIVKASLENGVQKNPYHGRQRLPSSPHSTAKGIPAEITFHRVTPSNCYKEFSSKKKASRNQSLKMRKKSFVLRLKTWVSMNFHAA